MLPFWSRDHPGLSLPIWESCVYGMPLMRICEQNFLATTIWKYMVLSEMLYIPSQKLKCYYFLIIPSELHVRGRESYVHHNFFQEHWICSEENSFKSSLVTWLHSPKFILRDSPWGEGCHSSRDEMWGLLIIGKRSEQGRGSEKGERADKMADGWYSHAQHHCMMGALFASLIISKSLKNYEA